MMNSLLRLPFSRIPRSSYLFTRSNITPQKQPLCIFTKSYCTSNQKSETSLAPIESVLRTGDENFEKGAFNNAIENFRVALEKIGNTATTQPEKLRLQETHLKMGMAYHRLAQFDEAKKSCLDVIDVDDKSYNAAVALQRLGFIYLEEFAYDSRLNKEEGAKHSIQYFERAASLMPEDKDIHYGLGVAFTRTRVYNHAETMYSRSIQADPEFAPSYHGRAETRIAIKDFKGALDDLNKFLEISPTYYTSTGEAAKQVDSSSVISDALFKRAYCFMAVHDWKQAAKDYSLIIQIDHIYVMESHMYRAKAHLFSEKYLDCIEDCNRFIQYNPEVADVFETRAAAYLQLGLATESEEDQKRASFLKTQEGVQKYREDLQYKIEKQKRGDL